MNSVELNTFIQQAICCAGNKTKQVADLLLQGSKCGHKELKNLAVLIDSIKALDCYKATLETEDCVATVGGLLAVPIKSIFTITIPCGITVDSGANIIFNGIGNPSGFVLNGTEDIGNLDLLSNFITFILPQLPVGYMVLSASGACGAGPNTYNIEGPCDITNYQLTYFLEGAMESTTINATLVQTGRCNETDINCTTTITEYTNCLTNTEANILIDNITKLCDICNCFNP